MASDVELLTAVTTGVALLAPGGKEVLRCSGADRVSFLHRIVTSDVAGTAVGRGCRTALLTIKGHVVHELRVFVAADEVRIVVGPGEAALATAALARYAIADDFLAVPDAATSTLALLGPQAAEPLLAAGVAPPTNLVTMPLWSHVDLDTRDFGELWLVRARACGSDGLWLFGLDDGIGALTRSLTKDGVPSLPATLAEALRIKHGEPKPGAEITSDHFPMELGLANTIAHDKGCYLGQEPIVRIRDRGRTHWRMVGLRFSGQVLPPAGASIESPRKPGAGTVTSAAFLPGEGGVALGLLHAAVPDNDEVVLMHSDTNIPARVVSVLPSV